MTIPQLARDLYIGEQQVALIVGRLVDSGIIHSSNAHEADFIYRPRTEEITSAVDKTAEYYSRNLVEVTEFLHTITDAKHRQFADAFRLRGRRRNE